MALKAGHVADFADSMAQAIEQAFQSEWTAARGSVLPEVGALDRKILFAAVAQGVLNYLEEHKSELVTNDVDGRAIHSHILDIDVS